MLPVSVLGLLVSIPINPGKSTRTGVGLRYSYSLYNERIWFMGKSFNPHQWGLGILTYTCPCMDGMSLSGFNPHQWGLGILTKC
jgi:hypothetical protein